MGWERRGNGRYYYRKHREGGRVVSEYVGTGPLAKAIAELDALDRERRGLEREAEQREREAIRAVDVELDEVCDLIRALTSAVLLTAGYHTHRGQWRRKREQTR